MFSVMINPSAGTGPACYRTLQMAFSAEQGRCVNSKRSTFLRTRPRMRPKSS